MIRFLDLYNLKMQRESELVYIEAVGDPVQYRCFGFFFFKAKSQSGRQSRINLVEVSRVTDKNSLLQDFLIYANQEKQGKRGRLFSSNCNAKYIVRLEKT